MAFFKRVLDHLLNQVLVEGLANSRWFQRFAVGTTKAVKDLQEKSGSCPKGRFSARLAHGLSLCMENLRKVLKS